MPRKIANAHKLPTITFSLQSNFLKNAIPKDFLTVLYFLIPICLLTFCCSHIKTNAYLGLFQ